MTVHFQFAGVAEPEAFVFAIFTLICPFVMTHADQTSVEPGFASGLQFTTAPIVAGTQGIVKVIGAVLVGEPDPEAPAQIAMFETGVPA